MACSDTWWPAELLSTNYVNVKMEHTLAPVPALVDHSAISVLVQAFLASDLSCNHHQVTEQLLVPLLSLSNSRKSITVLGDHQEVLRCDRGNITERQTLIILVDHVRRDLLSDNLIEDGIFLWYCSLCLLLLVASFHT